MQIMDMQSAVIARLPVPDELASFKVVKNLVTSALLECCSIDEFEALVQTSVIESVSEQAHADLQAFARKTRLLAVTWCSLQGPIPLILQFCIIGLPIGYITILLLPTALVANAWPR